MKKIFAVLMAMMMVASFAACNESTSTNAGTSTPAAEATADVTMKYITADEAEKVLNDDGYVFFDVRKAADSSAESIPGAVAHDMDAAKEGDAEAGKTTMTAATKDLDKNLILVCYSGKRYAQATTNALSAIGYNMDKVFTLEGGFTAWKEAGKATTANAPAEAAKPEAIDLNAKVEEIKAATGADITATVAAEGMTFAVKAESEDVMNAVNEALVAVLKDETFVAANLFENSEEKVEKAYTIEYSVGGDEVTHKTTAKYASSKGRKGVLYVCNGAWSGPKAVEA